MTENTAPKRRGRKPKAAAEEEKVEETTTPAPEKEEPKTSAKKAEAREERGTRIIPLGAAIDVSTDDNGYALETVYREVRLMGSKQRSKVLVARKGTLYNK